MSGQGEHIDALRVFILEHEQTICSFERRLDDIRSDSGFRSDIAAAGVTSQIEFLLLNVRGSKMQKEAELEAAIRMMSYTQKNPPMLLRLDPRADDFPPGPEVYQGDFLEVSNRLRMGCSAIPACAECERLALLVEQLVPFLRPSLGIEPKGAQCAIAPKSEESKAS